MKKLNIEISLEDNDVFEKEIEEIIRAKVRQIVRSEHNRLLVEQAHDEVKRLTDSNTFGYRDKLRNIVKEVAYESIRETLQSMNIDEIVKEGLNDRIENRILWFSDIVNDKCRETLDKTINEAVSKKLKGILG